MRPYGFTLSELLISLAILGVIAAFTIPKVLNTQQDAKYNSIAKEVAGAISEAYQIYKTENAANAQTTSGDITPYFNYVSIDTSAVLIDLHPGLGTRACNVFADYECMRMHNGAVVHYAKDTAFCGTNNNVVYFYVDPDGVSGGTNGESVLFYLYFNGRIRTSETIEPGTQYGVVGCGPPVNPIANSDPTWFSWN